MGGPEGTSATLSGALHFRGPSCGDFRCLPHSLPSPAANEGTWTHTVSRKAAESARPLLVSPDAKSVIGVRQGGSTIRRFLLPELTPIPPFEARGEIRSLTFSDDPTIIEAMASFKDAFRELNASNPGSETDAAAAQSRVKTYYENHL